MHKFEDNKKHLESDLRNSLQKKLMTKFRLHALNIPSYLITTLIILIYSGLLISLRSESFIPSRASLLVIDNQLQVRIV